MLDSVVSESWLRAEVRLPIRGGGGLNRGWRLNRATAGCHSLRNNFQFPTTTFNESYVLLLLLLRSLNLYLGIPAPTCLLALKLNVHLK